MATPTELYDLIRNMMFDADVALSSENDLYHYMSVAETEIAKKIPCTESYYGLETTINLREYTMPTGTMKIIMVKWKNTKLKKIRFDDLNLVEYANYGPSITNGLCVYYYLFGNKIGLSPKPSEVDDLEIWYLKRPTALSSISTAFTIPEEYSNNIANYCLYRMYLKDDLKAEADRALNMWIENLRNDENHWNQRIEGDMNETVQLEEMYPTTEIGLI